MSKAFATAKDFGASLAALPRADVGRRQSACHRQQRLTKPPGSLGRLEDIAVWLAGWQQGGTPRADNIKVVVFAGNHGVASRGVSPYPPSVTEQMVANFESGGAAINQITCALGLDLQVMPLNLQTPTNDILTGAAMSVADTLEAINIGAAAVDDGLDILITGEMGIGNTTIAAALSAAVFGGTGADWAGPGTGHDKDGIARKADVIDKAMARFRNECGAATAFETLRQLGGREQAAIAGALLAAREKRIPVILDGYVVCASLAPLFKDNPAIVDHCIAGHVSAEPAHARLLQNLGLPPLLDLGMRLGEGTGAALAAGIVRTAAATHNQMATFEEAAVENRTDAG
ncbi:MAG: nicotinate-nucleotide--dimethylbenzimidazole phosphoribosyltransferase [Alphaproteobacteria bacterium]|nr:nicotinate-nucleotide--dimethylbenzimidazole phosphoribosyltransferase [Alphaproteobacteria bacterium]